MTLDATRARQCLKAFDFSTLFLEELGWDRQRETLSVTVDNRSLILEAIAHKRGMVAYRCPTPAGERLPDYATRRQIEQQVTRSAHEHFIIFTDPAQTTQIWQWVKREKGKPTACREHRFDRDQTGEALVQKLQAVAFALEQEEHLTLVDVIIGAHAGFDVERVTKRFYEQFQKEHAAFLKFIAGIPDSAKCAWYASAMLNRLMFVYFMQRKGFLDGDRDYLRNRLNQCQRERGKDRFYSFYRYFLLRLFHEGLGGRERSPELETLLGRIPYLNGGMFEKHPVEDNYPDIQIPDQAFANIFDYFDRYQWHLDERPLRNDNEINPDVLGYIFEKYINQKQMGAYYTKEDITEYISKNTILPFLFDAAKAKCAIAFDNPDGPVVWDLLWADPDRYIYPAVRHGVDLTLPPDIATGLDTTQPDLLERRKGWNKPAPADYALPTEIWREVVARRTRCEAIRAKLAAGEVRDINELITLNLDLRQFARDVIADCEGSELLRALWTAIEKVTVLDPTCGSGAFLFAALNILEPLYEACLERMAAFVADLDHSGEKHRLDKFSDFRQVLERVAAHPNRRYFILKSIILNNLFGVDIMEEATEICKLRLFLKLAAQVEPDPTRENLGIEPLPDIDFNIRAGNTLVGFATEQEFSRSGNLASNQSLQNQIKTRIANLSLSFDQFRKKQIMLGEQVSAEEKQVLQRQLKALDDELNRYLAVEYGKNPNNLEWLKSHQPFHWFVEFYGIMKSGGFDVIIGNPPYVEYSKIKKDYVLNKYSTLDTGNIYGCVMERSGTLINKIGFFGMIVPLSLCSSERMASLRNWLKKTLSSSYVSNFEIFPSKLFEGAFQRTSIVVGSRSNNEHSQSFISKLHRWYSIEREFIIDQIGYTPILKTHKIELLFKTKNTSHHLIIKKLLRASNSISMYCSSHKTNYFVFYQEAVNYWTKATSRIPYYKKNSKIDVPAHSRTFYLKSHQHSEISMAIVNSSLFYLWYISLSDGFHLNDSIVKGFPVISDIFEDKSISNAARILENDISKNSFKTTRNTKTDQIEIEAFKMSKSKSILDEIDRLLAKHYGFTDEELDFIINYDIKYRMGRDNSEE